MKLSKEEEIKLMEMIVDLDKQIKRLKIRRKNYKKQLTLTDVVSSCAIKKEKVEDLGASYKELDRDIDDKFM